MKKQKGFTIVELVIVIAVIGILAAVLIPTFSTIIRKSRYSSAEQGAANAIHAYGAEYTATHQGDPLPDGMVVENNGYYFVYLGGKLVEATKKSEPDNLNGNLTLLDKTIEEGKLAAKYDLYQLDVDGFSVAKAYLNSRSGTQKMSAYTDTLLKIDKTPTLADYLLRVEDNDKVYLISVCRQDVSAETDSAHVYGGKIIGTYAANSSIGTFTIEPVSIKNIIYLIPDGAGFGTYDMANALKSTYGTGVKDQATPITTDAIRGKTVTGLYLDDYMIATADTSMANPHGSATDSAAAGTALLCGEKTNYLMVGVKPDFTPTANILELARLEGKSTGFVTTKCLVDATPSDGLSHSLKRGDQDNSAYQRSMSQQILYSDADVVLCYGSDGGYYAKAKPQQAPLHDDRAADHGYTVVSDLASLQEAVDSGATKLFSDIQINYKALNETGEYTLTSSNYYFTYDYNTDYQAFHVLYDCDAKAGVDLTLMDMAKAALTTLSVNIDDRDGFCLVIEGGAIDNAAEGRNVRESVAEYLAFDEVFAYCVNWAKQRGDTIVVACPDHDSGGLYLPTTSNGSYTLDQVLAGLHDGTIARNTKLAGAASGHSPQNVPVWLYAPAGVRAEILSALGLPADASKDTVRTGTFYDGTVINDQYVINNSDIAHAVAAAAGLRTFAEANAQLFVDATPYGAYDATTEIFTFTNGQTVKRNTDYWVAADGITQHTFAIGTAIYPTNEAAYTTYDSAQTVYNTINTVGGKFYVPRCALVEMGYVSP